MSSGKILGDLVMIAWFKSMFGIVRVLCWLIVLPLKSRMPDEAEYLALQYQLNVVCSFARKCMRLRISDRFLLIWLYQLKLSNLDSMDSVINGHPSNCKWFWC